MKYLLMIPVLVLLANCSSDPHQKVNPDVLNFTTTDDAEIYFKNVRQSYYTIEERPDQGINIFKLKDQNRDADYPLLELSIVHNWRNDNAFLMVNPNVHIPPESSLIIGPDTVAINQSNMKEQLQMANKLYDGILDDLPITLLSINGSTKFLDKQDDRDAWKTTVFDFYRLTGVR